MSNVFAVSYEGLLFQAECYHYLFEAALKMHQMGLDWSTPNHAPLCDSGLNGKHVAHPSKVIYLYL